jgi:hypothetical protein
MFQRCQASVDAIHMTGVALVGTCSASSERVIMGYSKLRRTEPDRQPDDARGLQSRARVDVATKTPPLLLARIECIRFQRAPDGSDHASSPYASW